MPGNGMPEVRDWLLRSEGAARMLGAGGEGEKHPEGTQTQRQGQGEEKRPETRADDTWGPPPCAATVTPSVKNDKAKHMCGNMFSQLCLQVAGAWTCGHRGACTPAWENPKGGPGAAGRGFEPPPGPTQRRDPSALSCLVCEVAINKVTCGCGHTTGTQEGAIPWPPLSPLVAGHLLLS